MAVELDALDRCRIHALFLERTDLLDGVDGLDHDLLLELIEIHHSLDQETVAVFERGRVLLHLLRKEPELHADTVRIVCHRDIQNDLSVPGLPALTAEDAAADDHFMRVFPEIGDRRRFLADSLSENDIRVARDKCLLLTIFLLRCIRKLLLFFLILLVLFSPARVLSQDIVDLIPDALVIRLEETFGVGRGEVALNVDACKSCPLRKYLIQILDELILALAGNDRLRDSGVYRVPVKFKIGVQEHLMEERTDFLEFKEHAGPVVFVKYIYCFFIQFSDDI